MGIAYTKTSTALSIVLGFKPITVPSSHPNFDQLVDLVRDPSTTEGDITPLIDIPKAVETFTGGQVTVTNGRLFYKGYEVKGKLATIIIDLVKQGQKEAAGPFERFMEKAFANPDPRAAMDLFEWVAASNLPITPDGDILAWKAVREDYTSIHRGPRGHLDHSIGTVVSEPREETDGDPNRTCSRGLHFCSIDYLSHGYVSGGNRIVAVAISPEDVVAFPKDYGNSKGRCCKMTVVGEVPREDVATYYPQGRVYDGWSQPAKAAPKYSVGDRWTDAEGDTWQITRVNTKTLRAKLVKLSDGASVTGSKDLQFDMDTMKNSQAELVRRA